MFLYMYLTYESNIHMYTQKRDGLFVIRCTIVLIKYVFNREEIFTIQKITQIRLNLPNVIQIRTPFKTNAIILLCNPSFLKLSRPMRGQVQS